MLDCSPIVSGRAYSSGSPIVVTISSNFEAEVSFTISNVCKHHQFPNGGWQLHFAAIFDREAAVSLHTVWGSVSRGQGEARCPVDAVCLSGQRLLVRAHERTKERHVGGCWA